MSDGGKSWTPGKIFLLVLGIVAGLCVICTGLGLILFGDKIKSGFAFKEDAETFVAGLQKDYGKTSIFGIAANDRKEMILTIGVEGEITPERAVEVEDAVWRTVGTLFAKNGFFPVKHLAVGRPSGTGADDGNGVIDWSKNIISVEELVKRTGVPAPKLLAFLPEKMDGGREVKFEVKFGSGGSDDGTKKEQPSGEPGGK